MKSFLLSLSLLFFFLVPGITQAQTSSPKPIRKGEEIRIERLKAVSEKRQIRITAFFEKMMKRFEAAITRLEKLIERIEARMDKIDYKDKSDLNNAKDKLQNAKDKMEKLKDKLQQLLQSDSPKEAFKTIGKDVRDLKQDLIKIHRILVQIIGDLKGLREPK